MNLARTAMAILTEADVEAAALDWLAGVGWQVAHGPDGAPDTPNAERGDYGQVVLERRLRDALAQLNPGLPTDTLDDAFRKLSRPEDSVWFRGMEIAIRSKRCLQ